MRTFKEFLSESAPGFELLKGTDAIVAALKKHCSEAIKAQRNGIEIFRGWKGERPPGIYEPGQGTRISKNTTNYYTAIFDSNPANDGWPKRSGSFICTTSPQTARGYGQTHQIFPFDGIKIGEVNQPDIWNLIASFRELGFEQRIYIMNIFWDKINAPDTNMQDIIKHVKGMDPRNVLLPLVNRGYEPPAGQTPEETAEKLIRDLPGAYVFKDMGCTLSDSVNELKSGEVWFSGKCIMIPMSLMNSILKALE